MSYGPPYPPWLDRNSDEKDDDRIILGDVVVPQLPMESFLGRDGILPALDMGHTLILDDVVKALKDKDVLRPVKTHSGSASEWRWQWFLENPSKCVKITEHDVFKNVERVVDAIRQSSHIGKPPTLDFKCNSEMIHSADRNYDTPELAVRPDCYGSISTSEGTEPACANLDDESFWMSIGALGEFTKYPSESVVDNWFQTVQGMGRMMKVDPRRRFVFSFSINDVMMRIWFANRAYLLVSQPFDINEEYKCVVETFLRLMYASEEQLGWDTTMERLPREDLAEPFQYKIRCGDTIFKTVRMVSGHGPRSFFGRGTRLWEVREVREDRTEDPKPLVLKDSWVDSNRLREGDLWYSIRRDAHRTDNLEDFDRYFIPVRASNDVYIGHDQILDDTHCPIRYGQKALQPELSAIPKYRNPAAWWTPLDEDEKPADPVEKILLRARKVHYRVVFTEIGSPMYQLDTLSGALSALSDAIKGLRVLHKCGWVHCDLTNGNILVVDGVAKLCGLKYAMREDNAQSSDFKTDIPYFVATEVDSQMYHHAPAEPRLFLDREQRQARYEDPDKISEFCQLSIDDPTLPSHSIPQSDATEFKRNPLHDLESALWIGCWVLICLTFLPPVHHMVSRTQWTLLMKKNRQSRRDLFVDEIGRSLAMRPSMIHYFERHLSYSFYPLRIGSLCLTEFRVRLIERYMAAYDDRETSDVLLSFATMSHGLHEEVTTLLDACVERLRTSLWDLAIDVKPTRKRKAEKTSEGKAEDDGTDKNQGDTQDEAKDRPDADNGAEDDDAQAGVQGEDKTNSHAGEEAEGAANVEARDDSGRVPPENKDPSDPASSQSPPQRSVPKDGSSTKRSSDAVQAKTPEPKRLKT